VRFAQLFLAWGLILALDISSAGAQTAPTFSRDIAPIIFEHCASCHRPGGAGPFSLLTYADARLHARQMADVTKRRYMPPWKPSAGFGGPFVGERRLTDEKIATIAAWAEQGAIEGNPADLPPTPEQPSGWRLGTPGLVLTMKEPFTLAATGPDVYRNFALPIPISQPRYISALEFRPGNGRVHHTIIRIDTTSSSRDLDRADPQPGYDGMLGDRAVFPDGHFLGWTPGKMPSVAPEGMPWRLDPGTDLVLQVHMMPMGMEMPLQAEVGLYFTDKPPVQTPALLKLSSAAIDIPAGKRDYIVEDRYTLPVDLSVLALYPHTHYLGHRIESFAELPGGEKRWLLLIEDWDFNWQDEYRFVSPVPLPKGSTVVMRYTLDNSSANPRNPHKPPVRVIYGPQSTDEMAELMLQVLPKDPADHTLLEDDVWRKLRQSDITSFRALIARNPSDFVSHTALGVRYFEEGNTKQAIAELEEAIRISPNYASAHNNLGTALMMSGRPPEALEHYQRAVELEPDTARLHVNLGSAFQALGQMTSAGQEYQRAITLDPRHAGARFSLANLYQVQDRLPEAVAQYRVAIALSPDMAEAHGNLARTLLFQAKNAEAIVEYREALKRNPNLVASLADLSWLLATAPDEALRNPPEAVVLAERAADLTKRADAEVLDRLSAAYAAAGRFPQAVATARAAITLARQANDTDFADQVQSRLDLYLKNQPFRMDP
jgi:tetratricopeptide (TPR) repeat protein/mono/diheme cytochrome c family protein